MKDIIIGTAGHIDHGKTALIEALNGYNGDELEEEKKRGITIDLSFSNLSDGKTNIAFIDVPGHEKLVKNMASGAFGFDVALLVVDINEGVMPQTIEHLEILEFLNVKNVVTVLTKCDLCDKNMISSKESTIKNTLKVFDSLNFLATFKTSIYDKKSIDTLKNFLFGIKLQEEEKDEFFRYYIDRVFGTKGFGTVTTGTVLGGEVEVKEKIFCCDLNKEITVKNIQVHSENRLKAKKHQRTALNLNIDTNSLKRGYILSKKGYLRGFFSIDGYVKTVEGKKIKHAQDIRFICGTKHINATIKIYEKLREKENEYFVSFKFKQKLFSVFKERFVILDNEGVLGGGFVLDPVNDPIKKSKKIPILRALYKDDLQLSFKLLISNHKKGFGLISSHQRFDIPHKKALEIAEKIDEVFVDDKELVVYPKSSIKIINDSIEDIYIKNPYALLSSSSLKLRLKWSSENFIKESLSFFVKNGFLKVENGLYKRVDIGDIDIEKELEKKIYAILENAIFTPPAPYNLYDSLDIDRKLGDKIFKKLTKAKKIVRIAHNLFITSSNLSKIISIQKKIIQKEGYIDIKNFKTYSKLSRKYLIGYLEYLDRLDEIKKEGNRRYLIG